MPVTFFQRLRKPKIKTLLQISCLAMAMAVGMIIPSRIAITVTPSLKHRIYLYSSVTQANVRAVVKKGSYVNFMFYDPRISNGKTQRVMKKVTCMEGESIRVDGKFFYCGDEFIGRAKPLTKNGEPLNQFIFSGVIPKGKMFVSGDHIDSYDSRYWGFLDITQVIGVGHPIW